MESFQSKCQESKFGINFKQKAKKSKVVSFIESSQLGSQKKEKEKEKDLPCIFI